MNKLLAGAVAVGMLGSAGVFNVGIATAETAFIVPGTSEPVGPLKALYHFNPAMRPEIGAGYYDSANATKVVIPYSGSIRPLTGWDSETMNQSVAVGTNNLDAAIRGTDGPIVVTGLSLGTQVLDAEQAALVNDPNAPPADQLTFIKVSDAMPLMERLVTPGTYVPYLDYTTPVPVESQYDTINIVSEYDIYSDPPDRLTNVLALVNSALTRGHSPVAFSDPASIPPENVTVTTNSKGATTTTYFIPVEELPLTTQLRAWGVPKLLADELDVVMTPMVDAAYSRDEPPPPPVVNSVDGISAPLVQANLQSLPSSLPKIPVNVPVGVGPGAGPLGVNPIAPIAVARQVQRLLPGGNGVLPNATRTAAPDANGLLPNGNGLLPDKRRNGILPNKRGR